MDYTIEIQLSGLVKEEDLSSMEFLDKFIRTNFKIERIDIWKVENE